MAKVFTTGANGINKPLVSAFFLFLTLSIWSFSGPLFSGFDPTYHLGNIWCARGERPEICEFETLADGTSVALIPAELNSNDNNGTQIQADLAQASRKSPFYSIMNTFVTSDVTKSVLSLRLLNSLLTSIVFFALMYLSKGKKRAAILSAWTFTMVPVLIATLWQSNPRSWAYLSVMSSWAFLHLALENDSHSKVKSYAKWIFFVLSLLLAFTSRIDGTLFAIFSCSVVTVIHLVKRKLVKPKSLTLGVAIATSVFLMIRSFSSSLQWYTQFSFNSVFSSNEFLFVLIHLPESIADGLGLGLRYVNLGPNVIGIIGISLFSIALHSWFNVKNSHQVFGTAAMGFFLILVMFQISFNWPEANEPSGAYVAALLTALLGITAIFSNTDSFFPQRLAPKIFIVVLVSISHALSLYSKFEWDIRLDAQNNTYSNLSLNGGWWWNSPIGPNIVYLIGALTFPVWLSVSWSMIADPDKTTK